MSVHCMQKHVRACLFLGTVKAHVQCSFLVSGVHLETGREREKNSKRSSMCIDMHHAFSRADGWMHAWVDRWTDTVEIHW